MKYTVEVSSLSTLYVPNFIKIGSAIQKVDRGTHRNTDSMVIA
jgi:hypothetical protein